MDSKEYFEQKRDLLQACISLSEEILSSIGDIETVNTLLEERAEKISLLQKLDDHRGKAMMDFLSTEEKSKINQMVSLLLSLDRDTLSKLQQEQAELKKLMRANTQNHKLINYTGKHVQTSGRLLDKKK